MESIGSRLIKLRVKHDLKQSDVANIAGIKQSSVSDWESDKTKPSSKSLLKLSEYYNVSPNYILNGRKSHESAVGENTTIYGSNVKEKHVSLIYHRDVPIVSSVQAGPGNVALLDYDPDDFDTVRTYERCSDETFGLEVKGASMTSPYGLPTFPEGAVIIADPSQRGDVTDGSFIIAKTNGHDNCNFKQLRYENGRPYLHSLNPAFPPIFDEFRIIAKVIDYKLGKL